jgi:sugar lactone lactonase YvrE
MSQSPAQPVVEVMDPGPFELAEGPFWHDGALHWVDIKPGRIHRRCPFGERRSCDLGQSVGCFFPASDGGFIAGLREGLAMVSFDRGIERWVDRTLAPDPQRRFNDGAIDAMGRLWVGSMRDDMRQGTGELHLYSAKTGFRTVRRGLTIPNGLVFSPDNRFMYHIDTPRRLVEVIEFDLAGAELGAVVGAIHIPEQLGYPDGMCIDRDATLWIAHWGGGRVSRWDPSAGRMLESITIPRENVTACAFGGEGMDELFVTTAAGGGEKGAIYRCRPCGSGTPVRTFGAMQAGQDAP